MRKILLVLCIFGMLLCLFGCSSQPANNQEADESTKEDSIHVEPKGYKVGETIKTDFVEINLTEAGVAEDIRYTSTESGIQITSGPSVLSDKKYISLRILQIYFYFYLLNL